LPSKVFPVPRTLRPIPRGVGSRGSAACCPTRTSLGRLKSPPARALPSDRSQRRIACQRHHIIVPQGTRDASLNSSPTTGLKAHLNGDRFARCRQATVTLDFVEFQGPANPCTTPSWSTIRGVRRLVCAGEGCGARLLRPAPTRKGRARSPSLGGPARLFRGPTSTCSRLSPSLTVTSLRAERSRYCGCARGRPTATPLRPSSGRSPGCAGRSTIGLRSPKTHVAGRQRDREGSGPELPYASAWDHPGWFDAYPVYGASLPMTMAPSGTLMIGPCPGL